MLEEIIKTVDIYNSCLRVTTFKQWLDKENKSYSDILLYHNYCDREVREIYQIEQDLGYDRQIEETGRITKKKYNFIIDKGFLEETMELDIDLLEAFSDLYLKKIEETSIVAYKFQMRYLLLMLDKMLQDEELWKLLHIEMEKEENEN